MSLRDAIYRRSPVFAQTLLLNAYGLHLRRQRFGEDFQRLLAEWEESQWWDAGRLRELQDAKLRDLVRFAAASTDFYGSLWASYGVNVNQVQGVEDLRRLPTIDKLVVRKAAASMRSMPDRHLLHGHTSGTTGSPLDLWYSKSMVVANTVADWRQKHWGGLNRSDWTALFVGRAVVPIGTKRAPFWRANHVQKQLWCSSFHLGEEHLPLFTEEIVRRGISFLEGYPSTLFIVAKHVLRHEGVLPMRSVFTSSETLHPAQREAMRAAFQCEVFDYYGMAERVIFAGECECHGGKHLFDEYGVTELIDDDGQPVPDGTPGTLTGTSLWNRGMPLIRYRTSDVSVRSPTPCKCGRGLARLADIATKAEDVIVTPDGRFISPSTLTHPFKPFHTLRKSQIVQDALDHVLVKLVPTEGFSQADHDALLAGLQLRLGASVRLEVQIVDDIPADPSGKFRWVICKVPHANSLDWA